MYNGSGEEQVLDLAGHTDDVYNAWLVEESGTK